MIQWIKHQKILGCQTKGSSGRFYAKAYAPAAFLCDPSLTQERGWRKPRFGLTTFLRARTSSIEQGLSYVFPELVFY